MNVAESLADMQVEVINGHPDDALAHAVALGKRVVLLSQHQDNSPKLSVTTCSLGEASKINYYGPNSNFVRCGWRAAEGSSIDSQFGAGQRDQHDYPDGRLEEFLKKLVDLSVRKALKNETQVIMTFGQPSDHPDHSACSRVARAAAEKILKTAGRKITVLELLVAGWQPQDEDPYIERVVVEGNPASFQIALNGLTQNGSQHRITKIPKDGKIPDNWVVTPDEEHIVDEHTYNDLAKYGFWQQRSQYGVWLPDPT